MSPLRSSPVRQAGRLGRPARHAPLPARGRIDGRRRTRTVRRASAGLTAARAGALLALLLAGGGLYGAATSEAFSLRRTQVTGAVYTPLAAVGAALAVPDGQNLFALRTADLASRLGRIPAVRSAEVSVVLPDELRVAIRERDALLAWRVGTHTYLVDATGFVLAELGASPPAAAATLPLVDDRRAASTALLVGATIDAVSLDAALRLGSLRPADVGSDGTGLSIAYDDIDGFTIRGTPSGWTAVFGFYTPTLRSTDLIPEQVRLLRSDILGREDEVARVTLADDRTGTEVLRATPAPSASKKP